MFMPTALRKSLALAALFAGALGIIFPAPDAGAQQPPRNAPSAQGQGAYPPAVGGYSLTLRDVWGPAKMPPAPQDFGPHFDFPPEPLNGGLLHDPYPN